MSGLWKSAAKQSMAGVVTAACIVAALCLACWLIIGSQPRFDPTVWQAHREAQDETLTDQADAIVRERALDGLNRQEVIEILGPPTFEEPDRMGFVLGPERYNFPRMDREWLTVWFGTDGRVSRYKRWQD